LVLHGSGYGADRRRHGNPCNRITTPFQKWTIEVGPPGPLVYSGSKNP
jgi:hypothetical protein